MKIVLSIFVALLLPRELIAANKPTTLTLITIEHYKNVPLYKEATEFIHAVLQENQMDINVVEAPLSRGLQMVNSGEADFFIAAAPSVAASFKNMLPTSFPYLKSHLWIYFRNDSEKFKKGISLNKLDGVALLNSPMVFLKGKGKDLKLTGISSAKQGLMMILHKRADYILANKAVIQGIIDESPKEFEVLDQKSLYEQDLFLWTHKKNKALLPELEKQLKIALKSKQNAKYHYLNTILNIDP